MNREQKKARGQAAMHRAQELAKNGQFRLRSVLSRTAIVVDFVFDGAPPLTEGIVRLRNRAEAMSRFARMTLAIRAGADYGKLEHLMEASDLCKIMRQKFDEFVKTLDPKLLDEADKRVKDKKFERAEANLRQAIRAFVSSGGSMAGVCEILDLMQVEQVQPA